MASIDLGAFLGYTEEEDTNVLPSSVSVPQNNTLPDYLRSAPAQSSGSTYSGDPTDYVGKYAQQFGVPIELARSLIGTESGGDPSAVSQRNAHGVTQLIPSTAREMAEKLGEQYSDEKLYDPDTNTRWGMRYLAENLERYDGDPRFALVAYNAGPSGADQVWEDYQETGVFNVPRTKRFHDGNMYTADYVEKILNGGNIQNADSGAIKTTLSKKQGTDLDSFLGIEGATEAPTDSTQGTDLDEFLGTQPPAPIKPEDKPFINPGPSGEDTQFAFEFPSSAVPEDKKPAHWFETVKTVAESADAFENSMANSLLDVFTFGLTGLIPESEMEKQYRQDHPIATIAGEVAGTLIATIGMGGAGAVVVGGKIGSKLLTQLAVRGGVGGIVSAAGSVDDVVNGRKTVQTAIGDIAQNAAGAMISIVPEVFAPAGVVQLLAQPLTDLAFDAVTDKLRGFDVGSADWWKREALSLGMSAGFAIRDVRSGSVFRADQADQRAEILGWLKNKKVEIIPDVVKAPDGRPELGPENKPVFGPEPNPADIQAVPRTDVAQPVTVDAGIKEPVLPGLNTERENGIINQEGTGNAEPIQKPAVDEPTKISDAGNATELNPPVNRQEDFDNAEPWNTGIEPATPPSDPALARAYETLVARHEQRLDEHDKESARIVSATNLRARAYQELAAANKQPIESFVNSEQWQRITGYRTRTDQGSVLAFSPETKRWLDQEAERWNRDGAPEEAGTPPNEVGWLHDDVAQFISEGLGSPAKQFRAGRPGEIYANQLRDHLTNWKAQRQQLNDEFTKAQADLESVTPRQETAEEAQRAFLGDAEYERMKAAENEAVPSGSASVGRYAQTDAFAGTPFAARTPEQIKADQDKAEMERLQNEQKGGNADVSGLPMFDRQGDLFDQPAPSGNASVGKYAQTKGVPPPKEPTGQQGLFRDEEATLEREANFGKQARIEAPEIHEMIRTLGANTKIKKILAAGRGRADGLFRGKKGSTPEIEFRADIFIGPKLEEGSLGKDLEQREMMIEGLKERAIKNGADPTKLVVIEDKDNVKIYLKDPEYSNKVASHELFHFVDYLSKNHPETLSRGNLLGHIAGLYKHYDRFLMGSEVYDNKQIREELKRLSRMYKPFNPDANKKYTTYRNKPSELFADAGSVLINNPELLRAHAPVFSRALFDFMDRRPEVKRIYEDIQKRIGTEELYEKRQQSIREMAEDAKGVGVPEKIGDASPGEIARDLFIASADMNYGIEDVMKSAAKAYKKATGKKLVIPDNANPLWQKRSADYSDTEQASFLSDDMRIAKELEDAGLTHADMHELMFEERIIHERDDMANPRMFNLKAATEQREYLKNKMGEEKFNKLDSIVQSFRKRHMDYVVKKMEDSGMFNPELIDYMKKNPYYATFAVAKDSWGHLGADVSSKIYGQVGTLNDIKNTYIATIMKDMTLIRAANQNTAKKTLIEFMQTHHPKDVIPAKMKFNGMKMDVDRKSTPGEKYDLLAYLDNGDVKAFWVPNHIAVAYKPTEMEKNLAARWVTAKIGTMNDVFRSMYTKYDLGFALGANPIRDYKETVKKLPGLNVPLSHYKKFLPYYLDAIKVGKARALGLDNATLKAMEQERILPTTMSISGLTKDDMALEKTLVEAATNPALARKHIKNPLVKTLKAMEYLNTISETASKAAAYMYLKDNTDWSPERIAHYVRRHAGTPDFKVRGTHARYLNLATLFLNTWKEGLRSNFEIAKERPLEYAWKTAKNIAPIKTMMTLAGAGILGSYMQEWYDSQSEYNKRNYGLIPVGRMDDGKFLTLRLPFAEIDRVTSGFMTTLMDKGVGGLSMEDLTSVLDYTAGQLPGLSPGFSFAMDLKDLLTGKNPKDKFRNKDAIPKEIWDTGDPMEIGWAGIKYMWNKYGIKQLFKFDSEQLKKDPSVLEKAIGIPIMGPFVGRFVTVSDYGNVEKHRKAQQDVAKKEASARLDLKREVRDYVDAIENPSPESLRSFIMQKKEEARSRNERVDVSSLKRTFKSVVFEKFAGSDIEAVYRATSPKQQQASIDIILDRRKITGPDREREARILRSRARQFRQLLNEF